MARSDWGVYWRKCRIEQSLQTMYQQEKRKLRVGTVVEPEASAMGVGKAIVQLKKTAVKAIKQPN